MKDQKIPTDVVNIFALPPGDPPGETANERAAKAIAELVTEAKYLHGVPDARPLETRSR